MKVYWADSARCDRAAILEFISQDNPLAAIDLDERFAQAASRLATHPQMGDIGKIHGTRELIPHENYRLVYEVGERAVWILAVVHTARLWPPQQL